MPENLIILPILIPLTAGVLALLFTGRRRMLRVTGSIALALNLAVALWLLYAVGGGAGEPRIFVSQMGQWPAPFGISVVADPLAAIMLAVSAVVVLASYVYCLGQLPGPMQGGFFHTLFHLLTLGVQWSFLTGDLFNLFVAFEIMLMASYVLLVNGTTPQQMRQAYKYILLNLFGSMLFVTCCGLIYGQVGTLNLADLTRIARGGGLPESATPVFALLLLVFGLKTAIFPLWFWLPDTYYTVPAGIGGLFGGLLTKVGAYVLIRIFVMILGDADGAVAATVRPIILVSAGVTMFLGVLGAVSMGSIRRILSIHIISQVGYMILGVGLALELGLSDQTRELIVAGAIFFIVHNMVVKSCLFQCGGLMQHHAGSDDLDQIGGIARRAPWLGVLFLIAALSLAGLPPLSGFFGKLVLIREALGAGHFALAAVALATSVLTLLSMLKIWGAGFWSEPKGLHFDPRENNPRTWLGMSGAGMLVLVALSMGLAAGASFDAARAAARSLVDPDPYIAAVLGPEQIAPLRAAPAPPVATVQEANP